MIVKLSRALLLPLALCAMAGARADTVQVAVAANFSAVLKDLGAGFEKTTGHRLLLSPGATGALYAQIRNGAPFDLLLAADQARPERLENEALAVPGTRFSYATGRLARWSANPKGVDAQGDVLRRGGWRHLAIASPELAPYGAAAVEVLKRLGLMEGLQDKLLTGESIGQAYAFVATGNAELGLVALSQVWEDGRLRSGSAWVVPQSLHAPIRQDAVLLLHGKGNPAALALLRFLRSAPARELIRAHGYDA